MPAPSSKDRVSPGVAWSPPQGLVQKQEEKKYQEVLLGSFSVFFSNPQVLVQHIFLERAPSAESIFSACRCLLSSGGGQGLTNEPCVPTGDSFLHSSQSGFLCQRHQEFCVAKAWAAAGPILMPCVEEGGCSGGRGRGMASREADSWFSSPCALRLAGQGIAPEGSSPAARSEELVP